MTAYEEYLKLQINNISSIHYITQKKSFSRVNVLHFPYISMVKLQRNSQNPSARHHGNQILIRAF